MNSSQGRLQFDGTLKHSGKTLRGTFYCENNTLYFFPNGLQSLSAALWASVSLTLTSGMILLFTTELARLLDSQARVHTAGLVLSMIFGPLFLMSLGSLAYLFRDWRQQRNALKILGETEEYLGTSLSERMALCVDAICFHREDVDALTGNQTLRLNMDNGIYEIRSQKYDPDITELLMNTLKPQKFTQNKKTFKNYPNENHGFTSSFS